MALISQIKGTDNISYNLRDDVHTWGGRNLALHSKTLDVGSAKTNLYISKRGSATIQSRNDGFYEVKCTAD